MARDKVPKEKVTSMAQERRYIHSNSIDIGAGSANATS